MVLGIAVVRQHRDPGQRLGGLSRQIKKQIHPHGEVWGVDQRNFMRGRDDQAPLRLGVSGGANHTGSLHGLGRLQHGFRGGTMAEIHHRLRLGHHLGQIVAVVPFPHDLQGLVRTCQVEDGLTHPSLCTDDGNLRGHGKKIGRAHV